MAAPSGETAQAVIIGSLPSAAAPAPSTDPGAVRAEMPDGTIVEHAGGTTTITAPAAVVIAAPAVRVLGGSVTVEGG